jgi:hypothetical protein
VSVGVTDVESERVASVVLFGRPASFVPEGGGFTCEPVLAVVERVDVTDDLEVALDVEVAPLCNVPVPRVVSVREFVRSALLVLVTAVVCARTSVPALVSVAVESAGSPCCTLTHASIARAAMYIPNCFIHDVFLGE